MISDHRKPTAMRMKASCLINQEAKSEKSSGGSVVPPALHGPANYVPPMRLLQ